MYLLPPKPGVCPVCAVGHGGARPHNGQSLYYQYWFYFKHGRWPTWADAIAHCEPELQRLWRQALEQEGVWTEPEDGVPIASVVEDEKKVGLPEGDS